MTTLFQQYEDPSETFGMQTGMAWRPTVDVVDEDREYLVQVELPGVHKKEIMLDLVSEREGENFGEKSADGRGEPVIQERRYGRFRRTIPLARSCDTDPSNMRTRFAEGILEIRIPKEATARKRIEIGQQAQRRQEPPAGTRREQEREEPPRPKTPSRRIEVHAREEPRAQQTQQGQQKPTGRRIQIGSQPSQQQQREMEQQRQQQPPRREEREVRQGQRIQIISGGSIEIEPKEDVLRVYVKGEEEGREERGREREQKRFPEAPISYPGERRGRSGEEESKQRESQYIQIGERSEGYEQRGESQRNPNSESGGYSGESRSQQQQRQPPEMPERGYQSQQEREGGRGERVPVQTGSQFPARVPIQ